MTPPVELEPSERVLLALGSNLGDRLQHLRDGIRALRTDVDFERASGIYETSPVGRLDQPDFLNAVVSGTTRTRPEDLLERIHAVERGAGRVRHGLDGPRTLDVDILFFGDRIMRTPRLTVPHPRWADRAFVLVPLVDVEPEHVDPVSGRAVASVERPTLAGTVVRFADRSALEAVF